MVDHFVADHLLVDHLAAYGNDEWCRTIRTLPSSPLRNPQVLSTTVTFAAGVCQHDIAHGDG